MKKMSQSRNTRRLTNITFAERTIYNQIEREVVQEMLDTLHQNQHDIIHNFYGNISVHQGLILFLYYLISGVSYNNLSALFDYPSSNFKVVFGTIRHCLNEKWCTNIIPNTSSFNDAAIRSEISSHIVNEESLKKYTMLIDGCHIKIKKGHKNADQYMTMDENWKSFKTNQNCANILFICDMLGRFVYISQPFAAGKHDMNCAKTCSSEINSCIVNEVDLLLGDCGFEGINSHINSSTSIPKKPKGRRFTHNEVEQNRKLAQARSLIERRFGQMKNTFKLLVKKDGFDGRAEKLYELVFICSCILNRIIERNSNLIQ